MNNKLDSDDLKSLKDLFSVDKTKRINRNNKQIKEKVKLLTEKLAKYGLKEIEDHKGKKLSHIEFIYINQYQKNFTIWVNTVKRPIKNAKLYQANNMIINNMYYMGVPYFETSFHYDLKENN